MFEKELEQEEKTLAAERGRSPSDAASVFGGAGGPIPQTPAVDRPQEIRPVAEAGPPIAASAFPEEAPSNSVQAADAFPDEEPFPEEPFKEVRRPCLVGTGKAKGRRLVKPEVRPRPAMTPEQRLLILDTWQRSGLPGGRFRRAGGAFKT